MRSTEISVYVGGSRNSVCRAVANLAASAKRVKAAGSAQKPPSRVEKPETSQTSTTNADGVTLGQPDSSLRRQTAVTSHHHDVIDTSDTGSLSIGHNERGGPGVEPFWTCTAWPVEPIPPTPNRERRSLRPRHSCPLADTRGRGGRAPPGGGAGGEHGKGGTARPRQRNTHGDAHSSTAPQHTHPSPIIDLTGKFNKNHRYIHTDLFLARDGAREAQKSLSTPSFSTRPWNLQADDLGSHQATRASVRSSGDADGVGPQVLGGVEVRVKLRRSICISTGESDGPAAGRRNTRAALPQSAVRGPGGGGVSRAALEETAGCRRREERHQQHNTGNDTWPARGDASFMEMLR
ncbi:hypothetical protein EYF80_011550 [Liparis tanakae]|uniref:Uncharacterized protein n=1 Tax=Liparis tanakae TaxID=230148 RepID=A0A4Z2IJY2_9TELE|nr:hypothetical protein EYF80_011550 [Liparis tanakae]